MKKSGSGVGTRILRYVLSAILHRKPLVAQMSNAHCTPYPVQNSTLSTMALAADLARLYSFSAPVDCTFFRKGICDTYRVSTAGFAYYLKVYRHGRRTLVDVEEEVRLVRHLFENGISIARPIRKKDDTYITGFCAPEGTRYAVLFEAARGVHDDHGDLAKIAALGRLVGRMHRVLDSFPLPYRRRDLDLSHLIDDNLDAIGEIMSDRPSDFRTVRSIAAAIGQLPLFRTTRAPEYGPCHGDLHGGDVAYDRHGNPTLFDFDSSGCGWRAYDIGVFPASVEWMDLSEATVSARERRLASFLESYQESRVLTAEELAVVRASPAIRHIFLMGHVLKHTTITEGSHWANDSFIDWHMKWFRNWISAVESA